jgi:hypothetical protein
LDYFALALTVADAAEVTKAELLPEDGVAVAVK